jgi:osmotically-inducible protein OsmY
MRNRKGIIWSCLVLAIIVLLAACASTSTRESTGEYIDDSVITTKVKAALAKDDFLKSFKISVETFKGMVQLSGFVDTAATAEKAEKVAKKVNGVKTVKNNLIVK